MMTIQSTPSNHSTQQSPSPAENSPFDHLPTELLYLIFEKLNPESENNVTLTCRRFYPVVKKIREIRHLREIITKALGNIFAAERPKTEGLKGIADQIFEVASANPHSASKEIQTFLGHVSQKPCSHQNHLIKALIESWKACRDASSNEKKEDTFRALLKFLYRHHLCSPANRLHIASLAQEKGLLQDYAALIESWNAPLDKPSPQGVLYEEGTAFKQVSVPENIIRQLLISGENSFCEKEIVAIDHEGNLAGRRKKLFYGVVREIQAREPEKQYRVYTLRHEKDGKVSWIFDRLLRPWQIGKIPASGHNDAVVRQDLQS